MPKKGGKKQPDNSLLKTYRLSRAYNIRVYERGYGKFVNDEDAVEAARHALLGDVMDYTGAKVEFQQVSEAEPTLFDLNWMIDETDGVAGAQGKLERLVIDNGALRPGYVTTDDLYDLLKEMSELDPEWPSDRRAIISLFGRAKGMFESLEKQTDGESKTWPSQT